MARSCRKDSDVSGVDGESSSLLSAKHNFGAPGSEAKNLVRGRVVMMEGVDTVAPLRRPAVLCEDALHDIGEIGCNAEGLAVEKHAKGAVRHPA